MHSITVHPIRTLIVLLVVAFGFFTLSAAGQSDSFWKNGPTWLGNTAWIFFMLSALLFVVFGVLTVVRTVRAHRPS